MAGGWSVGCPQNAGAAGTFYDAYVLSLRVDNDNITTETETPLLDFSTSPLWTNVYVENNAKVLVPLLWSRVQVCILFFPRLSIICVWWWKRGLGFSWFFVSDDFPESHHSCYITSYKYSNFQANDCISFGEQSINSVHNFFKKVRGQISLLYGSSIIFGLSNYPVSEFELVAEELLMSDSIIKVKLHERILYAL